MSFDAEWLVQLGDAQASAPVGTRDPVLGYMPIGLLGQPSGFDAAYACSD